MITLYLNFFKAKSHKWVDGVYIKTHTTYFQLDLKLSFMKKLIFESILVEENRTKVAKSDSDYENAILLFLDFCFFS